MGVPLAAGGGVVGLIVLLATVLLGGGGGGGGGLSGFGDALETDIDAPASREEQFVEFLADDTQAVWADLFAEDGRRYEYATVNTFTGQVSTGCGTATSAVGPFYCPADSQVYLDLGFFDELRSRFGAPGDFAQAYVVAHEVGHHVQNLLGTSAEVRNREQAASSQEEANEWSVRLELQADCYAGVWASHAEGTTDDAGQPIFTDVSQAHIDQALDAAAAIGDDVIQRRSGGPIDESAFTHGTAEQRKGWFTQGFETGDPRECDTFAQ